jgi:hypothetical protein
MRWYEAAGIGIVMGILYGVILWASVDSLSFASFILYGNREYLPKVVTGIVMVLSFLFLFTYPLWEPVLMQGVINAATEQSDYEEDDDE